MMHEIWVVMMVMKLYRIMQKLIECRSSDQKMSLIFTSVTQWKHVTWGHPSTSKTLSDVFWCPTVEGDIELCFHTAWASYCTHTVWSIWWKDSVCIFLSVSSCIMNPYPDVDCSSNEIQPTICVCDTHPAFLHTLSDHDDVVDVLLPNHLPEIVFSSRQWALRGDVLPAEVIPLDTHV